jgi:acetolactate synthase-1/2/3 large subunit
MNCATLVVKMLCAYDVRHVFAVSGDTNVPLYSALEQDARRVRHVMCRNEKSAGYMADAHARASNRPGVVEVPSVAAPCTFCLPSPTADLSSVQVITSDTPLAGGGRGVIAELDCARLFESITKGSVLVKSPAKIPEALRRAFRVASFGRPGAVHVSIPEDVLHEDVDSERISLHAEAACSIFPAYTGLRRLPAPAASRRRVGNEELARGRSPVHSVALMRRHLYRIERLFC